MCVALVSVIHLEKCDTIVTLWSAYLADIFAEVHLTISMNYFLLEAKVNHLFVSPFHHDIVETKSGTLAHAIYVTIS